MKIFKWRKSAPKKPEAFVLDLDRPRTLKYDLATVWALLRKLGVKDMQALYDLETSEIPEFVRAGLVWESPALSVADVRRMIQEKTGGDKFKLGQIMFMVHEAIISGCGCGK